MLHLHLSYRYYIQMVLTVRCASPKLVHVYLQSDIGTVRSTSPKLVNVYLHSQHSTRIFAFFTSALHICV